jgi:hypothetical protein
MSIDDCCDGSCSSLDAVGCEIISHEEVNKRLDKSLKYSLRERYELLFNNFVKTIGKIYSYLR